MNEYVLVKYRPVHFYRTNIYPILQAMKISIFSILFERNGTFFLYNTSTQSLLRIDKSTFLLLNSALKGEKEVSDFPESVIEYLKAKDFIDDSENHIINDFCTKMEYGKRYRSFSNKTLALVIAPTLTCNFACPYCYEANLPPTLMTEDVENGIIHFINSYNKTCDKLELCWEGGEPLIGFKNIQSLLKKIRTESLLTLIDHSIITNGYLLTSEICDYFSENDLNFAQITIDGNPETHNKSRILKSGEPTYDRILQNIDLLVQKIPKCTIVVRTNIHNGNKDEFGSLHNTLSQRWQKKENVRIVPAFVQPNSNCKVTCCSPHDKTTFFLDLKRKHNIQKVNFIPKLKLGSCSATIENSYIVDPKGLLYKCWNDIGMNERCIGNVFDGIKNNTLIAKYIVGSDKYKDSDCLKCKLFPICDGGCNRQRMDNIENNTSYNLCPFNEEGICDYLYEHYKATIL